MIPTPTTLSSLLQRHLSERPDKIAFIADGRSVTFAEFDRMCRATAAWLTTQGIGRGDRVAVWMVNRIEWLALLFGLARIGAALVAVNSRYRSVELAYILGRSGARLLVLEPQFRGIDFLTVVNELPAAAVGALEGIAVVGTAACEGHRTLIGKTVVAFDPSEKTDPEVPDRSDPEALATLFTTSGTTKAPKLVMHPQRTIALHSARCALAYGFDQPGACLLAAMPFCGIFGLSSVLAGFAAGAPAVVMDTFEPAHAAELLRRHTVTHVFGSDEMYRRIAEASAGDLFFPAARMFGFAAFYPGAAEFARSAWARGIPLLGLYGSNEVFALFSMQPLELPLDQRIEAGGRPASSDAEVRIRDVATGDLLPPGASGEIEIRAPTNFIGYLNDPKATDEAMCPDGFFRTGDVGRLRSDGTFVFETRKGDAIRLAGYLVNPIEIEDALKQIRGIADAQVVAVELDAQMRSAAFVIPAAGSRLQASEVIAAAAKMMAAFKVPARVWFVDDFPKTLGANGTKIQRGKLREMAMDLLRSGERP